MLRCLAVHSARVPPRHDPGSPCPASDLGTASFHGMSIPLEPPLVDTRAWRQFTCDGRRHRYGQVALGHAPAGLDISSVGADRASAAGRASRDEARHALVSKVLSPPHYTNSLLGHSASLAASAEHRSLRRGSDPNGRVTGHVSESAVTYAMRNEPDLQTNRLDSSLVSLTRSRSPISPDR